MFGVIGELGPWKTKRFLEGRDALHAHDDERRELFQCDRPRPCEQETGCRGTQAARAPDHGRSDARPAQAVGSRTRGNPRATDERTWNRARRTLRANMARGRARGRHCRSEKLRCIVFEATRQRANITSCANRTTALYASCRRTRMCAASRPKSNASMVGLV